MKLARPTRILVVDDSATTRFLIKRGLEVSGDYKVLAMFPSGEELLKEFDKYDPDAVLMDIVLEDELDGFQTAERLQKIKKIPIIFTSIDDRPETFERAVNIASFSFVLKPLSMRELRISIDFTVFQSRTEEELRTRDALMTDILETINTGIIYLNQAGQISYCNKAAKDIAAIDDSDFRTKLSEIVVFEEPSTRAPWVLEDYLKDSPEKTNRGKHLSIRRRDGESRIINWEISRFSGHSGQEGGWLMHLRDRTTEYQISKELEMAFKALEHIEEGVAVTPPIEDASDFQVIFQNPAFARLSETQDTTPGDSQLPRCLDNFLPELIFSVKQGERFQKEFESFHEKEGKKTMVWTTVPVKEGNDTNIWLHSLSDITEMRQLEANFRQSQKLEAVGQLAGGIAHDFNNILSIINSYADLIQLNFDESHPYFTYAKNISDSGRKGAALVAQLMSFSRRQDDSSRSVIDLVSAVQEIEDMLKRLIRESVLVDFKYTDSGTPILSNENMVEQILLNLLVNAQDAISGNGSIKVEVADFDFEVPPEGLGSDNASPGRFACISVSDTGSGIPEDLQERIFEPFFTTKDIGKGTGLGLSTVFGLVSDAGGIVKLESKMGEGTTFKLYFPFAQESTIPVAPEQAISGSPEGSGSVEIKDPERIRIVVVEDDEQFSNCIEGLLQLHGYDVICCNNGREALELGEEFLKTADLLVSDLVMPHLSGMDLAKEVLKINPEIKIIFMTGYSDTMPNKDDYPEDTVLLRKPFSISLIIEHLNKLLGMESNF